MDIILIAGLWLPVSVWDPVVDALVDLRHRPIAVSLPGVDDGSTNATLDEQLAVVLAAVDSSDRPLVVGHSAASTLAWLAADRRPDGIAGVVMIGGFPTSDGGAYADFFPVDDGVMPFPGWEPFDGPDSDDLDAAARDRLASMSVPVPSTVSTAVATYGDERRFGVPTAVVCPEFTPDDVASWIDAGQIPELARAERVTYLDIDSGHWPMITRPIELACLLDVAATSG